MYTYIIIIRTSIRVRRRYSYLRLGGASRLRDPRSSRTHPHLALGRTDGRKENRRAPKTAAAARRRRNARPFMGDGASNGPGRVVSARTIAPWSRRKEPRVRAPRTPTTSKKRRSSAVTTALSAQRTVRSPDSARSGRGRGAVRERAPGPGALSPSGTYTSRRVLTLPTRTMYIHEYIGL